MKIRDLLKRAPDPQGDPSRHVARAELDEHFAALPPPPKDRGRVELVVARCEGGVRETPDRVTVTPEDGVPGDRWKRSSPQKFEAQITVMRIDVAKLITNGQALTLPGDNLLVDLDLSAANLPAGSRLRIGAEGTGALVEVTPEPHNGCSKFRQRFGGDALRLTADPRNRDLHLRGIHFRVIEAGEVGVGDSIQVLSRGAGEA